MQGGCNGGGRGVFRRRDRLIHDPGFSLVELTIVLGVLGILGAMSIFGWQRYVLNTHLRTVARGIAADIFATREKAVSENFPYTITFDTTANTYTISGNAQSGTSPQIKSPLSFGPEVGAGIQISEVTGGAVMTFQARGTMTNKTITLVNGRGSSASITTNMAGRTHVQFAMQ